MEKQNFVTIFNVLHNFEWFYSVYKYSFILINENIRFKRLLLANQIVYIFRSNDKDSHRMVYIYTWCIFSELRFLVMLNFRIFKKYLKKENIPYCAVFWEWKIFFSHNNHSNKNKVSIFSLKENSSKPLLVWSFNDFLTTH